MNKQTADVILKFINDTYGGYSLEDAKDFLNSLVSEDGWISVEDRLPEEVGEYLCYNNELMFVSTFSLWSIYRRKERGFFSIYGRSISQERRKATFRPTHWMPLPEPPEITNG